MSVVLHRNFSAFFKKYHVKENSHSEKSSKETFGNKFKVESKDNDTMHRF